jgi:hypothetical protein
MRLRSARCWVWAWISCALAANGCALPSYEKVGSDLGSNEARGGAGAAGPGPLAACNTDFPATGACGACIARNCCEEAAACSDGACGEDLGLPISPVMQVQEPFDALVNCMQRYCDTEDSCDVSWGCVDNYRWPPLRQARSFGMRVINYASEAGVAGVEVKLCEASDPGCDEGEGLISTTTTGSDGLAEFIAPRGFNGYFVLSGGDAMPGVVQWSQPVHNVLDTFDHQALFPEAVTTLARVVGWRQDGSKPNPGTGNLLARAHNCLPLRYLDRLEPSGRGQEVVIEFAPQETASRIFYVNDMAILDPALDRTSSRGYAGAFEVPARNITVTASHADTGEVVSHGVVTVRPDTIGYLYLFPTPSR